MIYIYILILTGYINQAISDYTQDITNPCYTGTEIESCLLYEREQTTAEMAITLLVFPMPLALIHVMAIVANYNLNM